jgi:hypothetical protein
MAPLKLNFVKYIKLILFISTSLIQWTAHYIHHLQNLIDSCDIELFQNSSIKSCQIIGGIFMKLLRALGQLELRIVNTKLFQNRSTKSRQIALVEFGIRQIYQRIKSRDHKIE